MKKTLYIAAIAALFTLSSCQKEESATKDNYNGEDPVFTATIASDGTKALDPLTGKTTWDMEDEIEIDITDGSGTKVTYEVSEVSKDGRAATITKKESQTKRLGKGPYTAVCGESPDPQSTQTYSSEAPPLPMTATSQTTVLEFNITCGLLELSLKAGEKITSIDVTGTPTGGSETTYTLNCNNPVSIAKDTTKFYIVLPEGEYTSFLINGENGAQCLKEKSGSSVAITTNHITPVSFSKDLHFLVQLWKDGPYWSTINLGAYTPTDYGQYFAWGYAEGCIRNSAGDGWVLASDGTTAKQFNTTYFPNRDAGTYQDAAAVNWGIGWSVPTPADLENLIDKNKTVVEYVQSGSAHWSKYQVEGLLITGKTEGYTSNSIFLPSAGSGKDDKHNTGKFGDYWSNTESSFGSTSHCLDYYYQSDFKQAIKSVTTEEKYLGFTIRPIYIMPTRGNLDGWNYNDNDL